MLTFDNIDFDEPPKAHVRQGNRVSLLPIAQHCGKAAELSQRYGAGRAAAMSQAFHATAAGAPNARELFARLTEDEAREVASWKKPSTVIMGDIVLDYDRATAIEAEVVLDLGDVKSVGHVDFAWDIATNGLSIAFAADIKKTVWTTDDGPESLQLHGYGRALADLWECDGYCLGIWLATEGEWLWAKRWVMRGTEEWNTIGERLRYAALHQSGEASTGEHCRHCWSRLHCPEHLLPAAMADTYLAPLAEGGDITLIDHTLVLRLQAMRELAEAALKQCKAAVEQGGHKVRDPESGKVWAPTVSKGKESVDVDLLKKELGEGAGRYIKQGAPYSQMRWKNAR